MRQELRTDPRRDSGRTVQPRWWGYSVIASARVGWWWQATARDVDRAGVKQERSERGWAPTRRLAGRRAERSGLGMEVDMRFGRILLESEARRRCLLRP